MVTGGSGPRINGWLVLAHPGFARRYAELRAEAGRLRATLPDEAYGQHPRVKLAAQVHRLMTQTIPQDPGHKDFYLKGTLRNFRRAKGYGLPPRYRLFWTYSTTARIILFVYLNDEAILRKQGGRSDPYEVFQSMVLRAEIGSNFEANLAAWAGAYPGDHARLVSAPTIRPQSSSRKRSPRDT